MQKLRNRRTISFSYGCILLSALMAVLPPVSHANCRELLENRQGLKGASTESPFKGVFIMSERLSMDIKSRQNIEFPLEDVTYYQARDKHSHEARLPTIREFALEAQRCGAKGVRETKFPGELSTANAVKEEIDEMRLSGYEPIFGEAFIDEKFFVHKTVEFYYNNSGFERPFIQQSSLFSAWSGSVVTKDHQRGFQVYVLNLEDGSIYLHTVPGDGALERRYSYSGPMKFAAILMYLERTIQPIALRSAPRELSWREIDALKWDYYPDEGPVLHFLHRLFFGY